MYETLFFYMMSTHIFPYYKVGKKRDFETYTIRNIVVEVYANRCYILQYVHIINVAT